MTGIHKTALFLSGLPEESAQALLQRLEPTTAKKVRVEMMRLSGAPKEKVRQTVAEFLSALETEEDTEKISERITAKTKQHNAASERQTNGRKDVFLDLSSQIQTEETLRPVPQTMDSFTQGVDTLSRAKTGNTQIDEAGGDAGTPEEWQNDSHTAVSDEPFDFLHHLQPEQIRELLLLESPQIIAVVLSQIPSDLAGRVLEQMTPVAQKDVIARLLQLEEPDSDVFAEIEHILKERSEYLFERNKKKIGVSKAKEILKILDPVVRLNLLSEESLERMIAESNPDDSLQSLITESRRMIQEQRRKESYWADRRSSAGSTSYYRTQYAFEDDPDNSDAPRSLRLPMNDMFVEQHHYRKTTPEYQGADRAKKYRMPSERIDFESLEFDPNATPLEIESRKDRPIRGKRPLQFEDLQLLPDRGLKELFNSVDAETALVSLVGAPQDFIERIFNHCTPTQEKGLSAKLQSLGPIRQVDVENARNRILKNLVSE